MPHGVSLVLLIERGGGKLPSFLASVSLKVIVLSSDSKYNGMCFGENCIMQYSIAK
jgi:hypothetical protein